MSGLVKLAVFTLFFMLVRTLGIMGGCNIRYWAARRQSRIFVRLSNAALREHRFNEAIAIAERSPKSHIACLVASGLRVFQSDSLSLSQEEAFVVVRSSLAKAAAEVRGDLKTGLSALASIASTAPFVGLFGTVIGIFDAFRGCAMSKATCIAMTALSYLSA
jgi:biopolymer transport protein ExbB/biopolymer transport protein TolQ